MFSVSGDRKYTHRTNHTPSEQAFFHKKAATIQALFRGYKTRVQINSSLGLRAILNKNKLPLPNLDNLLVGDVLVCAREKFCETNRHHNESHAYIAIIKKTHPTLIIDVLELDKPGHGRGRIPEWQEIEEVKNLQETETGLCLRKLPKHEYPGLPHLFFCKHLNRQFSEFPIEKDFNNGDVFKLNVSAEDIYRGFEYEQTRLHTQTVKLLTSKLRHIMPAYGIYNCSNVVFGSVVGALKHATNTRMRSKL